MKIFAIYSKLQLFDPPEWIQRVRTAIGHTFEDHITLKQPCFIEENDINNVRKRLAHFLEKVSFQDHQLTFHFQQIDSTPDSLGVTILVQTKSSKLVDFQKKLVTTLKEYSNYVEPESAIWEKEFKPHVTVAPDLSPEQFKAISSLVPEKTSFQGVIHGVTLVIADYEAPGKKRKILQRFDFAF